MFVDQPSVTKIEGYIMALHVCGLHSASHYWLAEDPDRQASCVDDPAARRLRILEMEVGSKAWAHVEAEAEQSV